MAVLCPQVPCARPRPRLGSQQGATHTAREATRLNAWSRQPPRDREDQNPGGRLRAHGPHTTRWHLLKTTLIPRGRVRRGRAAAGSPGLRSPLPHTRLPEPRPAPTSHGTPGAASARPPAGPSQNGELRGQAPRANRPLSLRPQHSSCHTGDSRRTFARLFSRSGAGQAPRAAAPALRSAVDTEWRDGPRASSVTSTRPATGGGGAACGPKDRQAEWPRGPGLLLQTKGHHTGAERGVARAAGGRTTAMAGACWARWGRGRPPPHRPGKAPEQARQGQDWRDLGPGSGPGRR